jgi:hypothetical protein
MGLRHHALTLFTGAPRPPFLLVCAQLDLEVNCKRSKNKKDHLIFINFGVKKFTVKNTQEKRNFDV